MQEVRYNNVWNIVITLALPIPSFIAKYAIRAHTASTFPSTFTVRFFDVDNLQVGIYNRASEVFEIGETR